MSVLIPLNSGLVFTGTGFDYLPQRGDVLIPLNSGLVFTEYPVAAWCNIGLNPFEFRAGIYWLT